MVFLSVLPQSGPRPLSQKLIFSNKLGYLLFKLFFRYPPVFHGFFAKGGVFLRFSSDMLPPGKG